MDSYKASLVLENKATGVAETRAQIDTITKSVAQLAREDALWTQKQAQNARAREKLLRQEAQEATRAAREIAREKEKAARQAAQAEAAASRQAVKAARDTAREVARIQAQEAKATGRRSVFGVDTGVDLVNLASGLYTVQTAYRAVAQAAAVAMDAIQEAAKWEQYSVAITTMEGSAATAKQSLEDLYQIAKAPGIDLEGANRSYLQLRAIGIEGERAKTIISEFANTVARSGGSGVEFDRVNRQLVQMLANGRVLESELKWMKESMPELAKVMQATFGTTSAEGIRKLGISADEFVNKLTAAFAELPRAQETLTTEIENTATAWSKLKASFVDTGTVKASLQGLTAIFEHMARVKEQGTGAGTHNVLTNLLLTGTFTGSGNRHLYDTSFNPADRAGTSSADMIRAYEAEQAAAKKAAEDAEKERRKAERSAKQPPSAQNVDYFRALGPGGREEEMRYRWNAMRGGSGKEEAARNKAQKDEINAKVQFDFENQKRDEESYFRQLAARDKALKEIAAVGRGAKEQELVEAAEWRAEMEAAIGNDNAAYLRLEEAYGKKLADINEKYNRQVLEDEKKVQQERLAAMESFTSGMGSFAGALGGLIIQLNEKNTEAYAAMVAIQQGFAIAQATINMYVAMSQALTAPFPANLAAIGEVAAAGGQIISAITAMNVAKVGKGAFDKGGNLGYGEWGIAGEYGPEIVEGPARITSRRDTAKMLQQSGGGTSVAVNVHNYAGVAVATKQNQDGSIDLIIDKLEERLAEGVYTGSGKLGTAMSRTFGVKRVGR